MPRSESRQPNAPRQRRFLMPSTRAAVGPAVERILKAVSRVRLDPDRHDDLAVALTEALSNAAIHGNGLRPERRVRIGVTAIPGRKAVIDIKDSGQGFDPDKVADPTDPVRLLQAGGRGLYLMQRLMDRVEFLDRGSRVRLTIYRRGWR
jgi:anti-sigma regulatory factor (Ser/Thr protein kinase)